ncbi:single-stranded DNA-binding protein [Bifidobacterium amazonense]|uniref:Single-stranded DNA-binding protein n=1 Tax=Bifidobacterium amazonense TaxID=2809027 RepID=A0ABS9VSI7_9BIFI|nr:single-stranded DNA-binding protein [Bifidobacterium amazonense]MCH9274879.1 single-stranded DNA-binding protein [Bifidobacterium amazonense]
MAGETIITVVGNLTSDPELRTIGSGANVASFTIASTPRTYNRQSGQFEDGQALFMRCSAWRDLADHCAQTLTKGMRVIAQGRLQQRSYQAQDGSTRTVVEMQVDEIGPSLRYATAQVNRISSGQGGFAGRGQGGFNGGQNAGNNGFGGNGGYSGGAGFAGGNAGYQGGAGYSGGASAVQQQPAAAPQPQQPAADPWGSSDSSNGGFSSFGGSSDFGGSTDFGGSSDEPEF